MMRYLGCGIACLAVLMWVGPLGLAIFDMVTWLAGFGPVTGVDWFDPDRRQALIFWTMLGFLPMIPVFGVGLWIGDI